MNGRVIPHIEISEFAGPAKPTPQHYGFPLSGELIMSTSMTVNQKCTLKVTFTDDKGNPAKVEGPPVWLCNNTDVLALSPSDDGMSCECVPIGIPGVCDVQMTADADLGQGVKTLAGREAFNITAGQATTVKMEVGPVEDQENPSVPGGGTGPIDPGFGVGLPPLPGNRPPGTRPDLPGNALPGSPGHPGNKPPGSGTPPHPGGKPPTGGGPTDPGFGGGIPAGGVPHPGGKPPGTGPGGKPDAGLPGTTPDPKKK